MEAVPASGHRLNSLEAARGIASIIVVFHHFCLAFLPLVKRFVFDGGIRLTPLYPLVNGEAAVTFFFLLSGYVLTRRLYEQPSSVELTRSAVKRLPRLMPPAAVTIFAGFVILAYWPPYYTQAYGITGSHWLEEFGVARIPPNFTPTLLSAAAQTIQVFLLPDHFYYNSNLWTMFPEFYGSMIVFALVGIFITRPSFTLAAHAIGLVLSLFHKDFLPFVIGSLIAYVGPPKKVPMAAALIAFVLFWWGYWVTNMLGSIAILIALLGNERLSSPLSGRTGAILGAFSFPLYLVHTLVILSISSAIFVSFHQAPVLMAFLATILSAFILSLPLVAIERTWVPWLNRITKKFSQKGAREREVVLQAE